MMLTAMRNELSEIAALDREIAQQCGGGALDLLVDRRDRKLGYMAILADNFSAQQRRRQHG